MRRDRKLSFASTGFDYSRDAMEESRKQGLQRLKLHRERGYKKGFSRDRSHKGGHVSQESVSLRTHRG